MAEAIALHGLDCRLEIAGVRQRVSGVSGSEACMRAQAGLDPARLAAAAHLVPCSSRVMEDAFLSVVLPCRNQEDHIAEVLRSYAATFEASLRL